VFSEGIQCQRSGRTQVSRQLATVKLTLLCFTQLSYTAGERETITRTCGCAVAEVRPSALRPARTRAPPAVLARHPPTPAPDAASWNGPHHHGQTTEQDLSRRPEPPSPVHDRADSAHRASGRQGPCGIAFRPASAKSRRNRKHRPRGDNSILKCSRFFFFSPIRWEILQQDTG